MSLMAHKIHLLPRSHLGGVAGCGDGGPGPGAGDHAVLGAGDGARVLPRHRLHELGLDRGGVDALVVEEFLHFLSNLEMKTFNK